MTTQTTPTLEDGPFDKFPSEPPNIRTRFLTGRAGTGKTYQVRQTIKESEESEDPNVDGYQLCATTGIAALNLGEGVTTVHSVLGFYDYQSLEKAKLEGRLERRFYELATRDHVQHLVIDEVSMLSAAHLNLIHDAAWAAAERNRNPKPCGIWLVGDFCQLPPIPDRDRQSQRVIEGTGDFAFQAQCWRGNFGDHTERLTIPRRQSGPEFLAALNAARSGRGRETAEGLISAGVEFANAVQADFPGVTLCAKNDEADRYNRLRLSQLPGPAERPLRNHFWGTAEVMRRRPSEWKHAGESFDWKPGAYVMLLENKKSMEGRYLHVNGDCGKIESLDIENASLRIQLDRGTTVSLTRSAMPLLWKHKPSEFEAEGAEEIAWETLDLNLQDYMDRWSLEGFKPIWIKNKKSWLHGMAYWWPLRLAWASTVHKTQGLTLDRVQVDPSNGFFGNPASMYVALSRCREPQGIRVVGSPELVAKRTRVDERVREWL